ncbi:hypothetical protein GUJ93_ZPchr0010g10673 [Zizania palustris]|uniref:Uncharacterized protein n=1 Tax=Zizania palustris TaxID=103762 RepID=A0A8J6BNY5_ZIZPA|nr:hypothetical protein GUJ93_ZPchr0010g10673 [Zizania palustris]
MSAAETTGGGGGKKKKRQMDGVTGGLGADACRLGLGELGMGDGGRPNGTQGLWTHHRHDLSRRVSDLAVAGPAIVRRLCAYASARARGLDPSRAGALAHLNFLLDIAVLVPTNDSLLTPNTHRAASQVLHAPKRWLQAQRFPSVGATAVAQCGGWQVTQHQQ